jgi:D-alanyl-D-alanine dipeptidase
MGEGFPLREVASGEGIVVELQYRTSDNITGKPLYPAHFRAYATGETVEALQRAARELCDQGYEMVLLDAWRPPVEAAILWNEAVKRNLRAMYAPPGVSGHTRGTSVDITLRRTGGGSVPMPGRYDCQDSRTGSTTHSQILSQVMRNAGFTANRGEWWHFDHPSGKNARMVENPLEKRRRLVTGTQVDG